MTDQPPDEWGYWQASDGLWYPPELHPQHHRVVPPPPQPEHHSLHLTHAERAKKITPVHHRPGAGDYTVKPVVVNDSLGARKLAGLIAALIVAGAVVAALWVGGVFKSDESGSTNPPSTSVCQREKELLGTALFQYRNDHQSAPASEQALVPKYLDAVLPHWDFTLVGGSPVLKATNGCH